MNEIALAQVGASKVLDVLSNLNGQDCHRVLEAVARVRNRFEQLDADARKLFTSDPGSLAELLEQNRMAYSDAEPTEESIFVYFDLSTSVQLISYVAAIRGAIYECLAADTDNAVRYSDLKLQHSTAFQELIGYDLHISEALVKKTLKKYEPTFRAFLPFTLFVLGPHIASTGGIILECAVYSPQYYELRQMAAQDRRNIPQTAQRGIHEIIHSTVGYVTNANPDQMLQLHEIFKTFRAPAEAIPVRIRDGRIITTLNRRLIGSPHKVDFAGSHRSEKSTEAAAEALHMLIELAPVWLQNMDLRNLVLEEAIYWTEKFEWLPSPAHKYTIQLLRQLSKEALADGPNSPAC